jgi:hypothetical protein
MALIHKYNSRTGSGKQRNLGECGMEALSRREMLYVYGIDQFGFIHVALQTP